MAQIITRAGKGAPLTNNEVDANFTGLNTGLLDLSTQIGDITGEALATKADKTYVDGELAKKTTPAYVDSKVAALVGQSPETLDTLNELATALGNDPNFATTVANQIGTKADKTALNAVEVAAKAYSDQIKGVADAAMPKSGGNFTGPITVAGKAIDSVPIGIIASFLRDTPPEGWLAMNGPVPAATYPDLAATVPARFVSGGQILLQDLRDEFIRGSSATRPVGTKEGDAIRNITGHLEGRDASSTAKIFSDGVGAFKAALSGNGGCTSSTLAGMGYDRNGIVKFDASLVVPTASENRPRNVAYLWCIKAFGTVANPGALDASKLAQDLQGKLDKAGGKMVGTLDIQGGDIIFSDGVINQWIVHTPTNGNMYVAPAIPASAGWSFDKGLALTKESKSFLFNGNDLGRWAVYDPGVIRHTYAHMGVMSLQGASYSYDDGATVKYGAYVAVYMPRSYTGWAMPPNAFLRVYGDTTSPDPSQWFAEMAVGGNKSGTGWQNSIRVNGVGVAFAASFSQTSDLRRKSAIEVIPDALQKLDAITGYTYVLDRNTRRAAGVGAQDVQKVLPEAITEHVGTDETLTVDTMGVVALLTNALKELHAEHKATQAGLAKALARLSVMEAKRYGS